MPSFGRFDAYDEFGSSGPYSVWRARPAGVEGAGQHVIKTVLTQDMLADDEVVERRASKFLASAEFQRTLAGAGWATIEDLGRTPTHGYYVTAWYPTTLHRLVEARAIAALADGDALAGARAVVELISGVTAGLDRVQAAAKRGHGNLKPTNVLIKTSDPGGSGLDGAEVALCDPAPPGSIRGDGYADDLRALADLIHRLVTGREAPDAGAVQVGPEWSRLGSPGPGEQLRHVCEVLLNPAPGQALLTPAQVREQLAACLKAKMIRKRSAMPLVLGGAAAVLIAGGVAAYFLLNPGPKPRAPGADPREPSREAWKATQAQLIENAEKAIVSVRACMTDDQLARSDALTVRLEEAQKSADTLGGTDWPVGEGEDIGRARQELTGKIEGLEKNAKEIKAAADAIKVEVGDCSEEVDPRKPSREQWMTEREARLKAQVAEASAELGAELQAQPDPKLQTALDEMTRGAVTLVESVSKVRAAEWPVVGEAQASDTEAIRAAREARTKVRSQAQSLAAEIGQATQSAERLLRESRGRVAAYLDSRRRDRNVVQSDRLREAYGEAVGRLARSNPTWAQAREQTEQIAVWLRSIEQELAVDLQVALPANSVVKVDAAAEVFRAAKEKALAEAVAPLEDSGKVPSAGESTALLGRKKTELAALGQDIRAVLTKAGAIETLLGRASAYSEAGPGGGSIQSLQREIEASPRFAELERAVVVVLDRAKGLATAAAITSVPEALAGLNAAAGDAGRGSEAWTLWGVLRGAGYPSTPAQLTEAPGVVRDKVLPALAGLGDAARRDDLRKQVNQDLRTRWVAFVNDGTDVSQSAMDAAFKSQRDYGVSDADLAGVLQPHAKFNLERWKLLAAIEQAKTIADRDAQIRALQAIASGLQGAASTLGVASRADVQDLFSNKRKLAPYLAGKFSNFEEVGPAIPGAAIRWTMSRQDEDNGMWAEYTWNGHRLRFVRVGESEEPASFVCTSEVSVGLFKDVMAGANAWAEVKGMTMVPKNDQRSGPRAWVWDDAATQVELSQSRPGSDRDGKGWFRVLPGDINAPGGPQVPLYAPGQDPPAPTLDIPLNYVSPEGALYMSALIGCRVPTVDEWTAANRHGGGAKPNRRDALWVQHFQHLDAQVRANTKDEGTLRNYLNWPSGGVFTTPDMPKLGASEDKDPAVPDADGVLWFRSVSEGAEGFQDTEGNVAEIVLDPAAAYARSSPPARANLMGSLRDAVKSKDLRVVGASALSRPEEAPATPYPVRSVSSFWSDVGFRLAFTASAGGGGGGRLADKMIRILTSDTPYLTRTGG